MAEGEVSVTNKNGDLQSTNHVNHFVNQFTSGGRVNMTRAEAADVIESFILGKGGPWDWDDFLSLPQSDEELEQIRARCDSLPEEFPPQQRTHYCGLEGIEVLRKYVAFLRNRAA